MTDEFLLIDDKVLFFLKKKAKLLILKVLILLDICIGTVKQLFSYLLPIHKTKLWFLYCLSSHLTAHKPEPKSWGEAKKYCGSLRESENQTKEKKLVMTKR